MDWIFDNFQILALVGIALASWLKSRADAKAAEREEQQAREEMGKPEDLFGPTEYWQEKEEQKPISSPQLPPPPPFQRPKSVPPPPPVQQGWAEKEAALEAAKTLKHQMDLQQRLQEIRDTKAVTTGGASVTRDRQSSRKGGIPQQDLQPVPVNLHARLRKRGEIRSAVLMREILGPPLGLR